MSHMPSPRLMEPVDAEVLPQSEGNNSVTLFGWP